MKNLIEISKIVTKKRVKKIEIFDEHSLKHKNSKFNEFYESLMQGKFKTDRDAARHLYDTTPLDDKYRQLKSRFRKRLLNTLFFLDINLPATSNYDRAYFSCNKEWTLVKILLANDAQSTAAMLARHMLTTALKFKFADVIVNCSRILRSYAAIMSEEREYEEYDQYCKQFKDVLDAEIRSEELYQRVMMNYHKPHAKTTDLREKIDTYCEALVGLSEMYESPVVIYNMYVVWSYRFEMLHDYPNLLEVCNRAELYMEENPLYYQDDKLETFHLKKMSAYLHLRDYKNGRTNAEKCLTSFPQGSKQWFTFMEYYYLLAMHSENYSSASAILKRAKANPRYPKLMGEEKEKWIMFDVYLNFMLEKGDEPKDSQQAKAFKYTKFINEAVVFPKEHRFMVIHHIIAQVLFLLEKFNFVAASERIERLKMYANRQLKKDEHFRTIQFIRLLQQLPKVDYHPNLLSNVEKYHKRLVSVPYSYRGLLYELEIIPYEKQWDMILEILRSRPIQTITTS